jgi:hypothetical protein
VSLELDLAGITDKIEGEQSPAEYVDDAMVEAIWRELDGYAEREKIREVAAEVAAEFQRASIRQFVPIFVRRRTVERLRSGVD